MGDQVGASAQRGGGFKHLDALGLGKQETLAAAAAHKKARRTLGQVAFHDGLQRTGVDGSGGVVGSDAGGIDAAQLFFAFHW